MTTATNPNQMQAGQVKIPYNHEDLVAMKEDIANRKFNVRLKGLLIGGLFVVGALAAGFLVPGGMTAAGASGMKTLLSLGMLAGSAVTTLVTVKEMQKLELDEKYLESYMHGKNYWGEGYREEVAERGHGFGHNPQPFIAGAPPPPASKNHTIG